MRGVQLSENAIRVLRSRYLRRDPEGGIAETPQELLETVARGVSYAELLLGRPKNARCEMENKQRVKKIIQILGKEYPETRTALHFTNPIELLVATVLSAQCTDERVNRVTETLFKKYRTARDYAEADLGELQEDVRPTGFFKNKAKSIKGFSTELVKRFEGNVPSNLEDLISLPGVGRKTANLVLGEAFGIPGIVVDTHVLRLAHRIGLTTQNRCGEGGSRSHGGCSQSAVDPVLQPPYPSRPKCLLREESSSRKMQDRGFM